MEEEEKAPPKWMHPPYRKKKEEKAKRLTPSQQAALARLYYSPRTGFGSTSKIFKKSKYIPALTGIREKQIKGWMMEQPVVETHYPRRKPREGYDTITADGPGTHMQMDFLIYLNHPVKGYKYILCLIDVFSRFVAARPAKSREGETYTKLFKDMIEKDFGGIYPKHLNTDQEFIAEPFKNVMTEHNVTQHLSDTDEERKNSIVERFIRTLRLMIEKYRWSYDDLDWPHVLPDIIHNYNTGYHSTIKATPSQVMNELEPSGQVIRRVFKHFQKGDKVRIVKTKKTFEKGESTTLSNDVYVLEEMDGRKWTVKNLRTGEMLPRSVKVKELKHAEAVPEPEKKEHPEEVSIPHHAHEQVLEEKKERKRKKRMGEVEKLAPWHLNKEKQYKKAKV